jgi:hypothetical protein
MRTLWVILGLTLVLAGVALAHTPNGNANCNVANADETQILSTPAGDVPLRVDVPGIVPLVGGTTLYVKTGSQTVSTPAGDVSAPSVQVWRESNGYGGLQTHSHACRLSSSDPAGSTTIPSDTRLV